MATALAIAGFLALIGLPIYLMWGMPRAHRPASMASGEEVVVRDDRAPAQDFTDASHTASADGGSGSGGDP